MKLKIITKNETLNKNIQDFNDGKMGTKKKLGLVSALGIQMKKDGYSKDEMAKEIDIILNSMRKGEKYE